MEVDGAMVVVVACLVVEEEATEVEIEMAAVVVERVRAQGLEERGIDDDHSSIGM